MWLEYPYLFSSLVLTALMAGLVLVMGAPVRLLLFVGLINAPTGLLEVFFIPDYWEPKRLFNFVAGPEDFLFSGVVGIVAWVLAFGRDLKGMSWESRWTRSLTRFVVVLSVYVLGFALLQATALRVMTAAVICLGCVGAVLILLRPNLSRYAIRGGVRFAGFYFVFLWISFRIWGDWINEWNQQEMWAVSLGGVPLEEFLWAFCYGAVSPLATAFILGVVKSEAPCDVSVGHERRA